MKVKQEELQFLRLVDRPEISTTPIPADIDNLHGFDSADLQFVYALKIWSWALVGQEFGRPESADTAEIDRRMNMASRAFAAVLGRFPNQRFVGSYAQLGIGLTSGQRPDYRSLKELRKVCAQYAECPERGLMARYVIFMSQLNYMDETKAFRTGLSVLRSTPKMSDWCIYLRIAEYCEDYVGAGIGMDRLP